MEPASPHRLLEAPLPAYSDATVRRAFIAWLHCGHRNVFRDVCNYYHRLAGLEDSLPADRRASSRHQEFHLFYNPPPASAYLTHHFPKLYSQAHVHHNYIKRIEAIRNEQNVFYIEGFSEMREETGVTKQEIVLVSRMIRKYCKERQLVLRRFLVLFKEYTEVCRIKRNMQNVKRFIRSKSIQAEILLEANFPTDFTFLREDVRGDTDKAKPKDEKATANVDIDKPLQNGNNKTTDFRSNEIKLMTRVAVKSPKVKLETSDDDKENRNGDVINKYPIDKNVTVPMTILKRSRNHDVNLKFINSGLPETNFVKIGFMKS